MRLAVVDTGHEPDEAAFLDAIRDHSGREPSGVMKTLMYRPDRFGRPFSDAIHQALRGASDWTPGERELFAAFTSVLNSCRF